MNNESGRDDGTEAPKAAVPSGMDDPAVHNLLQGFMADVRGVPRRRIACIKSNPATDRRTDAQREQDLIDLQGRLDRGEIS